MTFRLADLPRNARHLGETTMAWSDQWWDDEVSLLWNPEGAFDDAPAGRQWHLVPQSAWYALGLLLRDVGDDRRRALRVIDAVIATQYDTPGTPWDGTFARFLEWPEPPADARIWVDYDPNWRQFVGTTFLLVLQLFEADLPAEVVARMDGAIAQAVEGEDPDRVPPSYSNIALMKAWLEVEHGKRSGSPDLVAAGKMLAADVVGRFDRHGTFEEHNSPTYYGIDLYALRLWRTHSSSTRLREWGARLEAALWDDVAAFAHAGLANLCGPWTRSYGMDLGRYVGAMSLWTWATLGREHAWLPDLDAPFAHGHDLLLGPCAAVLGTDIPPAAVAELTAFSGERLVEQTISSDPPRVATAWLEPGLMMGAESGEPGLPAWGQIHPATIHWRLPDGSVGWMRLRHRAPTSATVTRRGITATCLPHPQHGPQAITIEIHAPGLGADEVGGTRWRLPGLAAEVEASSPVGDVAVDGDLLSVSYEPVDAQANWGLTVIEVSTRPPG